jgi:hypothetical protein
MEHATRVAYLVEGRAALLQVLASTHDMGDKQIRISPMD